MLFHDYPFLPLYIVGIISKVINGNTVRVNTQDCFGLPESPITLAGAVVTHSQMAGRTLCYFSPLMPEQYLSLQFTVLTLPRQSWNCPTISLNEFSSVRDELIDGDDPNLRVPMIVPADPKLLFFANCTNADQMIHTSVRTSSPGLRLEMIFDPLSSDATDVFFSMTLTSFIIGPSFNCPSGTFRCWNDRSKCIPESLTCDGVNNCFDDSDENNYLCTGRINGIPIPLFAIIIVVSFLALVLIVTTVVFVLRKRKTKIDREEQTWLDMTIRHPAPVHQPLLAEKTWPEKA
ncbi:hypothetical protein P879_00171 [Paragonimus westermani]|uniref:Low-density lipoprotein receptor domain class A n=1 Tax=Paragonimus westermani TaxID=34504 RepID=A0A8T0DXI2_9TREM|nr:hypothetical protein P879_00171 [Paragonimus westermani]